MKHHRTTHSILKFLVVGLIFVFSGCVEGLDSGGYNGGYRDRYNDGYGYDRDDYRQDRDRERSRREREKLERERERYEDERRELEEERRQRERERAQPVCPSGFHQSDHKCTNEERKRGCRDMHGPTGATCVDR